MGPVTGALFIGNHGLEERDSGASRVVDEAQPYLARLRRAGWLGHDWRQRAIKVEAEDDSRRRYGGKTFAK